MTSVFLAYSPFVSGFDEAIGHAEEAHVARTIHEPLASEELRLSTQGPSSN